MDRKDNTKLADAFKDATKVTEELNSAIQELFDSITWWERIKWRIYMNITECLWEYLPMWKIHSKWYLFLIRLYGFKPLKCVDYMGEYTFIFKTQEAADKAFHRLENRGDDKRILVTGWWYGEKEFEEAKAECDMKIGWLI